MLEIGGVFKTKRWWGVVYGKFQKLTLYYNRHGNSFLKTDQSVGYKCLILILIF